MNTTSAAQALTLNNTGNVAMTISSIATRGPFAQTNNCGTSLAAGADWPELSNTSPYGVFSCAVVAAMLSRL